METIMKLERGSNKKKYPTRQAMIAFQDLKMIKRKTGNLKTQVYRFENMKESRSSDVDYVTKEKSRGQ